jgi:hypothetical protein
MMKKFILAFATISLLATLPSCTSKDSKNEDIIAEDGTAEDMAAAGGGEILDESLDSDQSFSLNDEGSAPVAPTTTDDQLTLDSFGETPEANTMAEVPPDENQMMADPAAPQTTEPPPNEMAIEQPEPEPTTIAPTEEIAPPMQEVAEQETFKAETDLDQPKPARRSLQKMASSPWKIGSKWVNAIYFARPNDSLESISQMIYGDDRTKELKKINPTYVNRDVKPGDKVYYASVTRPDDNSQIITYYEEKNIPSKTYVSKPGDNIRKLSSELLGYPEAWKEIWAYNTVESKQDIGEGIELRYWESGVAPSVPAMPIADQAPSESVTPEDSMMPPPPSEEMPPPPDASQNMAGNELPPPPPPMEPPPPPPSMDMAPPPPPPPPPAMAQTAPTEDPGAVSSTSEQDTTLAMGAVAVVVLGAVALIIVRRKRKQREMDQALGETHVG